MDTQGSPAAIFSTDRVWRYDLWRSWDEKLPPLMVIGLNPSTADETANDPTVRRCMGYARAWGFGGLHMANAFAYRSTDPQLMFAAFREMRPGAVLEAFQINDRWIKSIAQETLQSSGAILAAWGNHGRWGGRNLDLRNLLDGLEVACLGFTNALEPKHPLYLPRAAKPVPFLGDGGRLCAPRGWSNGQTGAATSAGPRRDGPGRGSVSTLAEVSTPGSVDARDGGLPPRREEVHGRAVRGH